jgi:hypothetical protein
MNDEDFLGSFRAGTLEPAGFDHRAHLRAALCALDRLPFLEACVAMRDGLQRLASRAGRPTLYHETITVALMALVADVRDDCLATAPGPVDVERLVERCPRLFDRTLVAARYRDGTLASDAARRRFRMPDAAAS